MGLAGGFSFLAHSSSVDSKTNACAGFTSVVGQSFQAAERSPAGPAGRKPAAGRNAPSRIRKTERYVRQEVCRTLLSIPAGRDHFIGLKDVDGREVALKELRGKTVFLDFWATWCEPCRKDEPEIKALYEQFKRRWLGAGLH
jgi:hypothetical protein